MIRVRAGVWVPWALFGAQLVVTAGVMGVLSLVMTFAFAYNPLDVLVFFNLFTMAAMLAARTLMTAAAAVLIFLMTGAIVGVLGMPIRLIPRWRRAWLGNGEWTVAGVMAGAALIFGSIALGHPVTTAFGGPGFEPVPWMMCVGWLMLALSLSLFVWPARWMTSRARDWWTRNLLAV